jgi:hypothetical protein
MSNLEAAGLDAPAQRVRHGARMAVVPGRFPAAGRGLRRSWRCALFGEHWRPSYLAERDPWLCVLASRRVCLFSRWVHSLSGSMRTNFCPLRATGRLFDVCRVWPVNAISGAIVSVDRLGCHGPLGASSLSKRASRSAPTACLLWTRSTRLVGRQPYACFRRQAGA